MNNSISRLSPPGASGVHDAAPSHGLESKSIRPNQPRSDTDPVETGLAAMLVVCTIGAMALFGWVVSGIIKP